MRLTLRTLLAYLDDRLPPNNAKEIGQKIANSPFATELVERIREVKRRRRLASPTKPQPTIDANLVAEYLDDQLTPELVARVEREVLASDALLAEVASAHEILGMLRDPVAIEPRLRDRLYLLDPTGQTEVVRALGGDHGTGATGGSSASSQWKPLKSHATSSRRWPIVAGAALFLVWIIVIATDSRLFGPVAVVDKPNANDALAANGDPQKEPVVDPVDGQLIAKADPVKENTVAADQSAEPPMPDAGNTKPADASQAGSDVSSPAKNPEVVIAANDPDKVDSSMANAAPVTEPPVEIPNVPEAPKADVPPPVVAPDVPEDDRPASYFVQTESAVTMVFDETTKRWGSLSGIAGGDTIDMNPNQTDCRSLTGRNWIGIPESFHSVVHTDKGGWSATLLGPSHVRLRGAPGCGFDVLSGRFRVSADNAVAWNDAAKPVLQLGIGNAVVQLVLQSKESRAAIEVIPVAGLNSVVPDEAVKELSRFLPADSEREVRVTVADGAVAVIFSGQADAPRVEQMVARNQRILWTVLQDGTLSSTSIDNGEPLAAAPRWLYETEVVEVPEQTSLKSKLLNAMRTNAEIDAAIQPLLSDKNPQIGTLAVGIPAVTRDVERLMAILYAEHNELVHRAAIDALSSILKSSPTGRELIQRSVETRLPMAQVEPAMKLITGITPAEAADPDVVADLMKMLEDNSLAARTLAIYRMEQHTNDRMNYFPDNEPSRRREAIRRWQRFLDRNQGKLLP